MRSILALGAAASRRFPPAPRLGSLHSLAASPALSASLAICVCVALMALAPAAPPRVIVIQTPSEGIQPQAVVDGHGVLHVIYFSGDPTHGDLHYVRRKPGESTF